MKHMKLITFKSRTLIFFLIYVVSFSAGWYVLEGLHYTVGPVLIAISLAAFISLMVLRFGWYTCPICKKGLGKNLKKLCAHCGAEISNDTEIGV
jgi:hypothetical protein